MDGWMLLIATALGVLALVLLRSLTTISKLSAHLSLLDRDQLLPRLRARVRTSIAITAVLLVSVLAGAYLQQRSLDRKSAELNAARQALDAARQVANRLQLQLEAQLEPAVDAEPQPEAASAPPTAAVSAPPPPADAGEWSPARILATGEVTLRAWPNGREVTKLPAGTELSASRESKRAGEYEWRKVRLPDGRAGWVVARFVVIEGGYPADTPEP